MPYSISGYQNFGGSPFQQYENQQQQNQLQQQQAQNQSQYLNYLNNQQGQGQNNPAFGGNQPNLGGGINYGGQQNYGGYPSSGQQQYNPLPTYGAGQNQTGFTLGGGVPSGTQQFQPAPWFQNNQPPPVYTPPANQKYKGSTTVVANQNQGNPVQGPTSDMFNTGMGGNPYQTNQQMQPFQYNPLQQYNFGGSPSGGTGSYGYM